MFEWLTNSKQTRMRRSVYATEGSPIFRECSISINDSHPTGSYHRDNHDQGAAAREARRVFDRHFPSSVLERRSYRRLIPLLSDTNALSFLQDADYVSDFITSTLHGLPPPLRNARVINLLDPVELEYGFSDGLRFLVSRGVAPSFEALVSELAAISDEDRLASRIGELVETLPLPIECPPSQSLKARRIDRPTEIRSLEKTWNNGLADYVGEINAGTCALYLWEEGDF
jgi:hypothetical protein